MHIASGKQDDNREAFAQKRNAIDFISAHDEHNDSPREHLKQDCKWEWSPSNGYDDYDTSYVDTVIDADKTDFRNVDVEADVRAFANKHLKPSRAKKAIIILLIIVIVVVCVVIGDVAVLTYDASRIDASMSNVSAVACSGGSAVDAVNNLNEKTDRLISDASTPVSKCVSKMPIAGNTVSECSKIAEIASAETSDVLKPLSSYVPCSSIF